MNAAVLPAAGIALGVTLVLAVLLPRIAPRLGLVDEPGGRKHHVGAVPLVGGLAMFGGFACGLFAWAATSHSELDRSGLSMLAAFALLVAVGMLDDRHDLRPRTKFAAQLVAAVLMASGAKVAVQHLGDLLGFGPFGLGDWSLPFTAVCVLGVINAVNMQDGVDGLAGSVTLAELGLFALAGSLCGTPAPAWVALLAASVAGFLAFNLRLPGRTQAHLFMGDAGSMMLGIALTWIAVVLTQSGQATDTVPPMVAVWILAVPLADMARVMLARVRGGRSMLDAGRDHLHHLLQARGCGPNAVVAITVAASLTCGGGAILAWRAGVPDWILFGAFMAALAAYCAVLRAPGRQPPA